MSDPVTNMAIEDVLSSIRRLVSEGDKPARPDPFAIPVPVVPAAGAEFSALADTLVFIEKLVLTPALRIATPVQAATEAALREPVLREPVLRELVLREPVLRAANITTMPGPALVRPQGHDARSALEQRIAELEAAVTLQPDEWEPDGSEGAPVVDWTGAPPVTLLSDGPIFASRAAVNREPRDVLDLGKIATRITLLDAGQSFPDAGLAFPDAGLSIPDAGPSVPEAAAPHSAVLAAPDGSDRVVPEEFQDIDLGEDLDLSAERATGGAGFADGFTDGDGDDADADAGAGDITGLLDEAMLRDLVAQVVRQELQGDLGERITRNVRKMVRREIYRVLASQELE